MKTIVKLLMIIGFVICVCSCANKEEVLDNISRGIYDSLNQDQEMKREPDSSLPSDETPPSYDQYKKEREKVLQEQKETTGQQ